MAQYLVIRLSDNPAQPCAWIAVDSNGTRQSPPVSGPLEEAIKDIGDRDVIVLVPATDVVTTSIDIPIRGGSRLQAALPYALEEQLADDVDTLHFSAGSRRASGLLPVAVVSRALIKGWIERLESAGIRASRIVPENHGLAQIPGTLSMMLDGQQLMFNDGADTEFVMQDVRPSDALAVAGVLDEPGEEDEQTGPGHLIVYCGSGDEQRYAHDWNALRHELASVDVRLLPDGVLPRLAVTVAAGHGINLLQGEFGNKAEFRALLSPWRAAAMLLLGLGVLAFAGKAVDTYRLGKEAAALEEQFTAEYREINPEDTRDIVDPIATVISLKRKLGTPTASQVFLPSLQELGNALGQKESIEIEAISYRAGVIDIRLTAPDVESLDVIQKQISNSGRFTAAIQSTDQVGDKVSSRIQIREVGA